jgi:hypothetical protein
MEAHQAAIMFRHGPRGYPGQVVIVNLPTYTVESRKGMDVARTKVSKHWL